MYYVLYYMHEMNICLHLFTHRFVKEEEWSKIGTFEMLS